MGRPLLEFSGVNFGYEDGAAILDSFDWRLDAGEFCCILGPSGSGKTTLLYLAAGIRRPSAGTVKLDGETVSGPSPRVGLMLQDYGLLPWYSARRNIEVGLAIRGVPSAERSAIADHWLDRMGLGSVATRFPAQLSGGQRQRIALARQFALAGDLLLLDEPLSAVDELTRERLQGQLLELTREKGGTTVMVTHSIEEAAMLASTILLVTEHGPISRAESIPVPFAGRNPSRADPEFQAFCQQLRERLRL